MRHPDQTSVHPEGTNRQNHPVDAVDAPMRRQLTITSLLTSLSYIAAALAPPA